MKRRDPPPLVFYTSAYRATVRGKAVVHLAPGERTLLAIEAVGAVSARPTG